MSAAPQLEHPRYRAGQLIGRGAQGFVVRVVDREDVERPLVAKVLAATRWSSALAGEFALLARSRIPGVVRAHDLARDAVTGAPFLVEDFVDGCDAVAWVRGAGAESQAVRLTELLAQIACSLGALHELGFVHGDLKPAHVRVGSDGRAVLLDLGSWVAIAADSHAPEQWATTRAYAAPELHAGNKPSVASDMYALGALAWACCTGTRYNANGGSSLARTAPQIVPSLRDIIEQLLAEHPHDRPASARQLLSLLGRSPGLPSFAGDAQLSPLFREALLEALLAPSIEQVRYVIGPPGVGKSHLCRALLTRALLTGRPARLFAFAEPPPPRTQLITAQLRGSGRLPGSDHDRASRELLILDDIAKAPPEIAVALDLYRCRQDWHGPQVIVTGHEAPDGALPITMPPLQTEQMMALLASFGVTSHERRHEIAQLSAGSPGWALSWLGRVPLTREAVLERARSLSVPAQEALAAIAVAGGALSTALLHEVLGDEQQEATALLLSAAMVRRAVTGEPTYVLTSPHVASEIAAALSSFAIVDRLTAAVLRFGSAPVTVIAALSQGVTPPSERTALLCLGIEQASDAGLRDAEMDFSFALLADPAQRTGQRLKRLERLARDSGQSALHPRVLDWLQEAASSDLALLPLALRRRAESRAREGDHQLAEQLALQARSAAARDSNLAEQALAWATTGVVAIYRGAFADAERALTRARADLPFDFSDQEERARLEHNLAVVLLYRGRAEDAESALVSSLARKRELGDRAGVRACLLNLGLACAKLGKLDQADSALLEAFALARSLKQSGGMAWCLAARADVAVRRRQLTQAERLIAEGEALRDAAPAAVRADFVLLRASVRVLGGDGVGALEELARLAPSLLAADPLVGSRASMLEARAYTCVLPVDRKRVVRCAVLAARRARAADLAEYEHEALDLIRAQRRRGATDGTAPTQHEASMTAMMEPETEACFAWLQTLHAGSLDDAASSLAKTLVHAAHAERGFVAVLTEAGKLQQAWGADIDGLIVAEAALRMPEEELSTALRADRPIYLRDIATPLGRGARLALCSPPGHARAVVMLEHRSRPGAFDAIAPRISERWTILLGVLARISGERGTLRRALSGRELASHSLAEDSEHALSANEQLESTTSLPLAKAMRSFPEIAGESPALTRALRQLDGAIDVELPVLLVGETGTGKELFACALHERGPRAARPFVAVNCGAVAESLFESEFFGHARGSFTGADRARRGLLQRAEGGTLLLDEVGELPLTRQAALLRALETRRFRPVGSDDEQAFDVRIIAATHRDLQLAVDTGSFRSDLLFRLNVLEIRVPPLREREGDVTLLARRFLSTLAPEKRLLPGALEALRQHSWPGNVRELQHLMQRLATLPATAITREMLPRSVRAGAGSPQRRELEPRDATELEAERTAARASDAPASEGSRAEARERAAVQRALAAAAGNITHAAQHLGLTRHGLKKRMVRLGMRKAVVR